MKRFMMFSVSILCLSIAVLIGFQALGDNAMAQGAVGAKYFLEGTGSMPGKMFAVLPNGDIYFSVFGEGWNSFGERIYTGNFWSGLSVDFTDAEYHFYYEGQIFAVLPGGDTYRGGIVADTLIQTFYLGNFWDGIIPTASSSWGSV
ncbi:MAG: hypothetical protein KOO63_00350, partial [Bacteroidales bacterium]|nr:hypothetical protein [Candidatus Latescibacterota bacterium]